MAYYTSKSQHRLYSIMGTDLVIWWGKTPEGGVSCPMQKMSNSKIDPCCPVFLAVF